MCNNDLSLRGSPTEILASTADAAVTWDGGLMLFLIMGASGSGKTSSLAGLRQRQPEIDWRDFDDALEHPSSVGGRQATTEYWLQIAVRNQAKGISTGLAGTTVLGEVLACPSAPSIEGISAILLDCTDVVRIDRIRVRDGVDSSLASQEMLCWAAWLRMHALDPQWRPDVVRSHGGPEMNWESWAAWQRGDERWKVDILDNSCSDVEETASKLDLWVQQFVERRAAPAE